MDNKIVVAIGAAVLVAVFIIGGSYNSLNSAKIEVEAQYGQIENQIQRRADLIPNLVSTVKGYMQYEEKVLTEVTEARTKVLNAGTPEDKNSADGELTAALGKLIAVSENYPELKSDAHFTELMREIAGSENRIAVARRDYNSSIRDYNLAVQNFPGNIFAKFFGFQPMNQFAAEETAHEVPQVNF